MSDLPGRTDGIASVTEARRRNPRLRVIFTSGAPPSVDLSALEEFIAKPTRGASLLDAIARQLWVEARFPYPLMSGSICNSCPAASK